MLTFTRPVSYKNYLYGNFVRNFKTPLGFIFSLIFIGISGANLYFFYLFQQADSLIVGLGLLLVVYFIIPFVNYRRAKVTAKAKEVKYFIDENHLGVELGFSKTLFQREALKSIKICKKYLRISIKNTITKTFFFFNSEDREKISQWLHASSYKNLLQ